MKRKIFSDLLFGLLLVSICFSFTSATKKYKSTTESSDYYNNDDDDMQGESYENHEKSSNIEDPLKKKKQQADLNHFKKPSIQKKAEHFPDSLFMDPERTYLVQWKTNITHITFEVQVKTLGWVGLGLSPTGAMTNSDIAVMWVKDGKLTLQDRFAKGFYEPLIDEKQNLIPLYGYENDTHTVVGFSRLLDTCDTEMDRKITRDTVHLLYAYHSLDPPNNQLMKHEHRGSRNVYLLDSIPDFVEPEHTKQILVTQNKYHVPHDSHTTYRCIIHAFKDIDKKYHLVGVKPVINNSSKNVVHHMLLHLCDAKFKNRKKVKEFMCYDEKPTSGQVMLHCFTFLLTAWAVGGPGYVYPKDLGLPLDQNMNGRFMVLETHYNNPTFIEGIVDSSGVVLYLTENLRKIESGQLFSGSFDFNWGLMIPPKQKEFSLFGLCSSECTNNMVFPEEGIYIFSFFLHTHLAGRKVRVKIIRNGKELEPLMKDDNYDFNYQEGRNLVEPIKIMKGDTILSECIYSTEDRPDYTFGGLSTTDEMCLIFFSYYPKTDFTVCGSLTNYPGLIKTAGLQLPEMENWSPAKLLDFSWQDPKILEKITNQMNTTRGKSSRTVKKLAKFYKNDEYEVVCRYMALPQFLKNKIPEYEHFVEPPTECDSNNEDYGNYE